MVMRIRLHYLGLGLLVVSAPAYCIAIQKFTHFNRFNVIRLRIKKAASLENENIFIAHGFGFGNYRNSDSSQQKGGTPLQEVGPLCRNLSEKWGWVEG